MVVDHSCSFAPPHTLTLSRPSASQKTIVNANHDKLSFEWTWQSLCDKPPLSWTIMGMDVVTALFVKVGGNEAAFESWSREESGVPMLNAFGGKGDSNYIVRAIAARQGVVIELNANFGKSAKDDIIFDFAHLNGWVISNKGWIDGEHDNILLTMNQGRADRMIAYAYGGDAFIMYRNGVSTVSGVPMSNEAYAEQGNSAKKLTMLFHAQNNVNKRGYIFLPYEKYFEDSESIKTYDFAAEFDAAAGEWNEQLSKLSNITVPDEKVKNCFRACVADFFVMREKVAEKYYGISCGTNVYRSVNSMEPLWTEILLDKIGFGEEAEQDARMFLEAQDESGCWAYSKGWEHEGWAVCFVKASFVMSHYRLTGDTEWLRSQYARLRASTLFNAASRRKNKTDIRSPFYGLMPRGMGDCGMMNGDDYYGHFYPHNFMTVAADKITWQVAEILGERKDAEIFRAVYEEAKEDLLRSVRKHYVTDERGNKMLPAVADVSPSSLYGCLFGYYPCFLLNADDPLVRGTLAHIEQCQNSEGGLPMGTGWLKDGLWVAMALDNFSGAYLRMGDYEKASAYIYPVLNHATPFVTWCEERGAQPNSEIKSGDLQHLWTPLSFAAYMTDALFFEDESGIHIAAGIAPEWLGEGKSVGVDDLHTPYGIISYKLTNRKEKFTLQLSVSGLRGKETPKCIVHLRTDKSTEHREYVFDDLGAACGKHEIKA